MDSNAAPRHHTVLLVLLLAQLMATMDNSIVAVATETIRDNLHTTGSALQLIMSGYTLAFAAIVVTGARLGDMHGQRRIFLIGLVGFTAASLVCGLAPNAVVLIVARMVQGALGALMVPQVLSLIQILFTGAARTRAISLYSMVLALAVAAGQIFGGLLVGANLAGSSWRAAFLVNVPIGVIVLITGRFTLPATRPTERLRLDLAGVAGLFVAMAAVVAPLAMGREQGWPAWSWVVLIAGFAGIAVFFAHEKSLEKRGGAPLMELGVLRRPGVVPGLLSACILNLAYAGMLFILTLHLQQGKGFDPIEAGLSFVPYPVGFATASLLWSRLNTRLHLLLPMLGPLLFAAGSGALIATAQGGWPIGPTSILLMLCGAGHAIGYSPLVSQIVTSAGPRFASAISALISTGTLLGQVISVAAVGGVYLSVGAAASTAGLTRAILVIDVLLLVAAYCAWRLRAALRRSHRGSEVPAPAGH